jgi:hypothetical protein
MISFQPQSKAFIANLHWCELKGNGIEKVAGKSFFVIKPLCGTFEILKVSFRFFFLIRKFKNLVFAVFSGFVMF